jgi:hypothetical protein
LSPRRIAFERNSSVIFCVASMKCGWLRAPSPRERVLILLSLLRAREMMKHVVPAEDPATCTFDASRSAPAS